MKIKVEFESDKPGEPPDEQRLSGVDEDTGDSFDEVLYRRVEATK